MERIDKDLGVRLEQNRSNSMPMASGRHPRCPCEILASIGPRDLGEIQLSSQLTWPRGRETPSPTSRSLAILCLS